MREASLRPITFLSDFGYGDEFAGVCRAVITRMAPEALITDLTHGIGAQDVVHGAIALANALPYTEPGIHLAIVDPGVGTTRRAIAARVAGEDRVLVGPDNGLLSLVASDFGGFTEAVDISDSAYALPSRSTTFEGRDLFSPVTAYLAGNAPLTAVGTEIPVESIAFLRLPEPVVIENRITAQVLYADGFGNLALNLIAGDAAGNLLRPGGRVLVETGRRSFRAPFVNAFAEVDPGTPLIHHDSSGRLAIAVNFGNAADQFELSRGDELHLSSQP